MKKFKKDAWKRVTSHQVLFQQGHRKAVQLRSLNTFQPKQIVYAVVCVATYVHDLKDALCCGLFKFALASLLLIYSTAVMLLSGVYTTTKYLATTAMLAITCSSNVIYSHSFLWQPCYNYLWQQLRMYSPQLLLIQQLLPAAMLVAVFTAIHLRFVQ